ncbi:hypothetical protein [Nannocystis sp. SCPEA4]|uniref:hypothetical protein n=1 Tax=Nannocystis sp. SCPEA4 TaxID=2996787 RepID=UPI0022707DD0|nr:hypothetical protein [Nannocystis sp. SCPEA4]MCY1060438.1 hypothetical protein [Nannocystis sp. SCPEA4]
MLRVGGRPPMHVEVHAGFDLIPSALVQRLVTASEIALWIRADRAAISDSAAATGSRLLTTPSSHQ